MIGETKRKNKKEEAFFSIKIMERKVEVVP